MKTLAQCDLSYQCKHALFNNPGAKRNQPRILHAFFHMHTACCPFFVGFWLVHRCWPRDCFSQSFTRYRMSKTTLLAIVPSLVVRHFSSVWPVQPERKKDILIPNRVQSLTPDTLSAKFMKTNLNSRPRFFISSFHWLRRKDNHSFNLKINWIPLQITYFSFATREVFNRVSKVIKQLLWFFSLLVLVLLRFEIGRVV